MIFINVLNISDGVIKGLFGQLAGFGWVLEDFIAEHGVVEGQAESDGVGGLKVTLGNLDGCFISFIGILRGLVVLGTFGILRDVTVVVSLHFVVKYFSLF